MARIHGFLRKFPQRIQMDSRTWAQISDPPLNSFFWPTLSHFSTDFFFKRCQINQRDKLHQIRVSPKVFETSPIYSPPLVITSFFLFENNTVLAFYYCNKEAGLIQHEFWLKLKVQIWNGRLVIIYLCSKSMSDFKICLLWNGGAIWRGNLPPKYFLAPPPPISPHPKNNSISAKIVQFDTAWKSVNICLECSIGD